MARRWRQQGLVWMGVGFALLTLAGCRTISGDEAAKSVPPTTVPVATLPPTTRIEPDPGSVFVDGCNRKDIGEDSGLLVSAYGVINGVIDDDTCLGAPNDLVVDAWNELAEITPPSLIEKVTVMAGYLTNGDGVVAYAGPLDNDSEEFVIAIDLDASEDDRGELRLTMAHELTHVFTQTTDQIDIAFTDADCDTFFNGFGCFQPDAYITAWVDTFWTPTFLDQLPNGEQDEEGGDERCELDASFPGFYAASHPEEDFAEAFSAFVWDVDMPEQVSERLAFFEAYPEFVAMRDNARATGLGPVDNNFSRCG